MKNLGKLMLAIAIIAFSISAANAQKKNQKDAKQCSIATDFDFVYPIQVIGTDGKKVTVNDGETLDKMYANLSDDEDLEYIFPLTVEYDTGEQEIVKKAKTLDEIIYVFIIHDFDFVYPVQVIDNNGETVTVNDGETLDKMYESIPKDAELDFKFPLTLEYGDGSREVVKDSETLEEIFAYFFGCDE